MDERTERGRPPGPGGAAGAGRPRAEAIPPETEQVGPGVARRRRPLRVVAGVAVLAAIGLLWPFAEFDWWPVVAGLGVLALLFVSRLDRLLLGWAPHLAGLLTVTLLLARTGPWVWGFAVGLAVLGAGLVRLPHWRVLAAGAALTAVFGIGYGLTQYRTAAELTAQQARTGAEQAANVMATAAELVLPSLTNSLAGGDARTACALLGPTAGAQLAQARRVPDCQSAARAMAVEVRDPAGYRAGTMPAGAIVKRADGASVDACRARWSNPAAGPSLGRFELRRHQAERFLIVGYQPCR